MLRPNIICTGDMTAYCADPSETVQLLRDAGVHVVLGNCEETIGNDTGDCGCGFIDGSTCDLLSPQWHNFALRRIEDTTKQWMRNRPPQISFCVAGLNVIAIHGGFKKINRYVFPSSDETIFGDEFSQSTANVIIAGHAGVPFNHTGKNQLWHNAGVIGMPANDGTNRGWYSLLEPQQHGIKFSHIPLNYDHNTASEKIRATHALPNDYADALDTGLWPSDDIMPPDDRQRRGIPLAPETIVWSR